MTLSKKEQRHANKAETKRKDSKNMGGDPGSPSTEAGDEQRHQVDPENSQSTQHPKADPAPEGQGSQVRSEESQELSDTTDGSTDGVAHTHEESIEDDNKVVRERGRAPDEQAEAHTPARDKAQTDHAKEVRQREEHLAELRVNLAFKPLEEEKDHVGEAEAGESQTTAMTQLKNTETQTEEIESSEAVDLNAEMEVKLKEQATKTIQLEKEVEEGRSTINQLKTENQKLKTEAEAERTKLATSKSEISQLKDVALKKDEVARRLVPVLQHLSGAEGPPKSPPKPPAWGAPSADSRNSQSPTELWDHIRTMTTQLAAQKSGKESGTTEVQGALGQLQKENAKLQAELLQVKQALSKHEEEVRKIENLRVKFKEMKATCADAKQESERFQENLNEQKQENEELIRAHASAIQRLKDDFEAEMRRVQVDLDAATHAREVAETALDSSSKRAAEATSQCISAQKLLKEHGEAALLAETRMRHDIHRLEVDTGEQQRAAEELRTALATEKALHGQTKTHCDDLEGLLEVERRDKACLSREQEDATKQLMTLSKEVMELQGELKSAQDEVQEFHRVEAERDASAHPLKLELEIIQSELKRQRRFIDDQTCDMSLLQEQYDIKVHEVGRLQAQTQNDAQVMRMIQQERNESRLQLQGIKDQLFNERVEKTLLRQAYQSCINDTDRMRKEMINLKLEIQWRTSRKSGRTQARGEDMAAGRSKDKLESATKNQGPLSRGVHKPRNRYEAPGVRREMERTLSAARSGPADEVLAALDGLNKRIVSFADEVSNEWAVTLTGTAHRRSAFAAVFDYQPKHSPSLGVVLSQNLLNLIRARARDRHVKTLVSFALQACIVRCIVEWFEYMMTNSGNFESGMRQDGQIQSTETMAPVRGPLSGDLLNNLEQYMSAIQALVWRHAGTELISAENRSALESLVTATSRMTSRMNLKGDCHDDVRFFAATPGTVFSSERMEDVLDAGSRRWRSPICCAVRLGLEECGPSVIKQSLPVVKTGVLRFDTIESYLEDLDQDM